MKINLSAGYILDELPNIFIVTNLQKERFPQKHLPILLAIQKELDLLAQLDPSKLIFLHHIFWEEDTKHPLFPVIVSRKKVSLFKVNNLEYGKVIDRAQTAFPLASNAPLRDKNQFLQMLHTLTQSKKFAQDVTNEYEEMIQLFYEQYQKWCHDLFFHLQEKVGQFPNGRDSLFESSSPTLIRAYKQLQKKVDTIPFTTAQEKNLSKEILSSHIRVWRRGKYFGLSCSPLKEVPFDEATKTFLFQHLSLEELQKEYQQLLLAAKTAQKEIMYEEDAALKKLYDFYCRWNDDCFYKMRRCFHEDPIEKREMFSLFPDIYQTMKVLQEKVTSIPFHMRKGQHISFEIWKDEININHKKNRVIFSSPHLKKIVYVKDTKVFEKEEILKESLSDWFSQFEHFLEKEGMLKRELEQQKQEVSLSLYDLMKKWNKVSFYKLQQQLKENPLRNTSAYLIDKKAMQKYVAKEKRVLTFPFSHQEKVIDKKTFLHSLHITCKNDGFLLESPAMEPIEYCFQTKNFSFIRKFFVDVKECIAFFKKAQATQKEIIKGEQTQKIITLCKYAIKLENLYRLFYGLVEVSELCRLPIENEPFFKQLFQLDLKTEKQNLTSTSFPFFHQEKLKKLLAFSWSEEWLTQPIPALKKKWNLLYKESKQKLLAQPREQIQIIVSLLTTKAEKEVTEQDALLLWKGIESVEGKFGITTIYPMLQGSKSAKMEKYHLTENPYYGTLSHFTGVATQQMMNELLAQRYIEKIGYDYPKIFFTKKGRQVFNELIGEERLIDVSPLTKEMAPKEFCSILSSRMYTEEEKANYLEQKTAENILFLKELLEFIMEKKTRIHLDPYWHSFLENWLMKHRDKIKPVLVLLHKTRTNPFEKEIIMRIEKGA